MKITRITQENFHAFQHALPSVIDMQSTLLFGCVLDHVAVGTAAVTAAKDGYSLAWLWVSPIHRRRGIGGALLDEVCRIVGSSPDAGLTVTYPVDAAWTAVLEYMLLVRGFSVMVHTYPRFTFTKEELRASPLMARVESLSDHHVVPLANLSRVQRQEVVSECVQQGVCSAGHGDFLRADRERSMVLIRDGKFQGLTLVSAAEGADVVSLDLLYLKKGAAGDALRLLRHTALASLMHPAGLREFHFICTEEAAVRICERVMGQKAAENKEYCHGVLEGAAYWGRRDSNG